MHTPLRYLLLVVLTLVFSVVLRAQSGLSDSVKIRLNLIGELVAAKNFERAQVEAEAFRSFLARTRMPCPPEAVQLLSKIYVANRDPNSALQFLNDAELDARRDSSPARKAALLDVLIVEYDRWNRHDQALAAQRLLLIARDSIVAQAQRETVQRLQSRYDSLAQQYAFETGRAGEYWRINRYRAMVLAGVLLVLVYSLLSVNRRNRKMWQTKLEQKALELDVVRAQQQYAHLELPDFLATTPPEEAKITAEPTLPVSEPEIHRYSGEQIALLIQPNRQIALYLKSLLSDRYHIETAASANEGLNMASSLMPDLIVCDTALDGKTGIEVVRQIKLSERTNHIPVILLTPRFGSEGKIDALRAGADGWFTRPVLDGEFNAEVKALVDGRKRLHENFSGLLHLYFSDERPPLPLDGFLQRTMEVIEENLSDPDFTPDLVAKRLQMSRPHFYKKLKWLTGKDPNQLIREMRLEKAKVLLQKRAGTPQAIAELVGFTSPGNFALAFKDYFGDHTMLLGR